MAKRIGPDRVGLEAADPQMVETLAGKDVEVVVPEIDHDLLQLAPAVERAPPGPATSCACWTMILARWRRAFASSGDGFSAAVHGRRGLRPVLA